jgi:hypothetical protein
MSDNNLKVRIAKEIYRALDDRLMRMCSPT